MPRKRIGDISESPELLRQLEVHYRRQPPEIRVRALRILRENPGMRIRDVAVEVCCSESSVQRWWDLYRRRGIAAVIGVARLPITDAGDNRSNGGCRPTARDLRPRAGSVGMPAAPLLDTNPSGPVAIHAPGTPRDRRPGELMAFLRSLPAAGGTRQWLETFRDALRVLLGDVDRVTVTLNVECDVRHPERYAPEMIVAQHVFDRTEAASVVTTAPRQGGVGLASRFLGEMRRRGFRVDNYHEPSEFLYFIGGTAYVGTILLWRDASRDAISGETLDLMRELEPMIVVLLSDCIARHQKARPLDRAFHGALRRMVQEAGLTEQEARIAMLQMYGRSYKDIADMLTISLDTVGKHINSIHRKTRTRGHAELFAKYFTRSIGGSFLSSDMSGSTASSGNL